MTEELLSLNFQVSIIWLMLYGVKLTFRQLFFFSKDTIFAGQIELDIYFMASVIGLKERIS